MGGAPGGAIAEQEFDYAAFISYSHERDARTAPMLKAALEQFPAPWYRQRRRRIYLDRGDLASSADLAGTITSGLERADFLILLASPEAAASPWVRREVDWWLRHRTVGTVIIVLSAGTVRFDPESGLVDRSATDALPDALVEALQSEPKYADLPTISETGRIDVVGDREWQELLADVVARLDGTDKDSLVGEHVRNRARSLRLRAAVIAALSVLLVVALVAAVVASVQLGEAQRQRTLAQSQQRVAQSQLVAREAADVREVDAGLAAKLDLLAYRLDPGSAVRDRVVADGAGALTEPIQPDPYGVGTSTGGIRSLALGPGGLLVAGQGNGNLARWALPGPVPESVELRIDQRDRWRAPESPVRSLAFSADGRRLVVADDLGVHLWAPDALGRQRNAGVTLLPTPATQVALSGDGRTLAVTGGGFALWDITRPEAPVALSETGVDRGSAPSFTTALAFSPDGRSLAVGDDGGGVIVWDVREPRRPLGGVPPVARHADDVSSIAWSPDGSSLVSGSTDGSLRVWTGATAGYGLGSPALTGHGGAVNAVAFDPQGLTFASAGEDGTIRRWAPVDTSDASFEEIDQLGGRGGPPWRAVTFSGDGGTVYAGGGSSTSEVRAWRFAGGRLPGHRGGVQSTAVAGDREHLATGDVAGTVRLWDLREPTTPRLIGLLRDPATPSARQGPIRWLAWHPTRPLLAVVDGVDTTIWDVGDPRAPRPVATLVSPLGGSAAGAAFSPDGLQLASTGSQVVQLFDVRDPGRPRPGTAVEVFNGTGVVFARGGSAVIVATDAGLERYEVAGLDLVDDPRFPGLSLSNVPWLVVDPATDLVASGSLTTPYLWSVPDRSGDDSVAYEGSFVELDDDNGAIRAGLRPGGGELAAGETNGQVRLWGTGSLDRRDAQPAGVGTIRTVDYGPADTLVVGGSSTTARVLALDPVKAAIERICAGRDNELSPDQWRRHAPSVEPRPLC